MHPEHYEHFHPGMTVARMVTLTITGIIVAVIIAFLFGYFVMLLWNWLIPPLFHAGTITYWQAFGLVILAKILFGGVGAAHHHDRSRREWRREARRWERWGAWPGCGDKGDWKDWKDQGHGEGHGPDMWAPQGSHRNWRYFGRYWREEGKAAYEAWLDRTGGEPKEEDKDKGGGPSQPKAE